jgi:hypothetical protein
VTRFGTALQLPFADHVHELDPGEGDGADQKDLKPSNNPTDMTGTVKATVNQASADAHNAITKMADAAARAVESMASGAHRAVGAMAGAASHAT